MPQSNVVKFKHGCVFLVKNKLPWFFLGYLLSIFNVYPVGEYLFKVNSRDIRTASMVFTSSTFNGICPISFAILHQLVIG